LTQGETRMKTIKKMTFAVTLAVMTTLATGCSSNPIWATLGQTLLGDLTNGTLLEGLEMVIAAAFPGLAADQPAIDSVLQAFISLFESLGIIPASAQPNVNAIKAQLIARSSAAKKSGYVMSPDTQPLFFAAEDRAISCALMAL